MARGERAAAFALVAVCCVVADRDAAQNRRIFVSVGSDDWGRWSNSLPVWPSREEREISVREMGWLTGGMPMLSTVESEEDLKNLRTFLQGLNDASTWRQRIVISPFWVVSGPDFQAMEESGCPEMNSCEYRELMWHNSSGGLGRAPYNRGDLRQQYRALFDEGLWHPEYHGRSHFDTRAWVAYLRGGDKFSRYYFRRGMTFYHYGLEDAQTGTKHTMHCEYLSDDPVHQKSVEDTRRWLQEGVKSFEAFWGYAPKVTSVPTHHAPEFLGELLAEQGMLAAEHNELDFLHSVKRFEVDLDSWLQMGGVQAVKQQAELQRQQLRARLREEDFLALQWHAQNALGGMYSAEESALLLSEFAATIEMLRQEHPGLVMLTASELAQVQAQGWSVEVWPHRLVVRNYNPDAIEWTVPDLPQLYFFSQSGARLRVRNVGDDGPDAEQAWEVQVGEVVVIGPDAELVLEEAGGSRTEEDDDGVCAGGSCWREEPQHVEEVRGEESGEEDWETGLYYARVYGDKQQTKRLEEEGRIEEVVQLGLRLKKRMEQGQQAALAEACERCTACRTCQDVSEQALRPFDPGALPALLETELFEEGVWQDRTAIRDTERYGEVSITFLSPRFGDHVESPGFIAVDIAGYDFETEGGYAVLAAGGYQVMAWRGPHIETALFGARGHIPQNIIVSLMGEDGRPLGVANNVVFWETAMSNPPRPGPKPTTNATSVHQAAWRAGQATSADSRRALWGDFWLQAPLVVRAPEGARVALVITSCVAVDGRLTLLEETVRSFLAANTYPIDQYILIDDSGDPEVHRRLLLLFGSLFDVLLNRRGRTGMTFSIDTAYSHVTADYIFHCQDDWLFHTKGDFIQQSMSILHHLDDALVVWCRDLRDHDLPMGPILHTPDGVPFHKVLPMSLWKGFSFNPGLRRVSDYKMMAPIQRHWFEDYVQGFMRWMGMYGVSLTQGWTRHTGEHHSTKPSYQAANEELARMKQGKGTL